MLVDVFVLFFFLKEHFYTEAQHRRELKAELLLHIQINPQHTSANSQVHVGTLKIFHQEVENGGNISAKHFHGFQNIYFTGKTFKI